VSGRSTSPLLLGVLRQYGTTRHAGAPGAHQRHAGAVLLNPSGPFQTIALEVRDGLIARLHGAQPGQAAPPATEFSAYASVLSAPLR